MTQKRPILARLIRGTPPQPKVGKLCFGVRRPLSPDTFKSLEGRSNALAKQAEEKANRAERTVYHYDDPKISDFRRNVELNQEALSLLSEAIELINQAKRLGTRKERKSAREKISAMEEQEEACKTEISDAQRVINREDSFDDYFFCDKRKARSQLHANNFSCDDY